MFDARELTAALIPMTSPRALISGPPLLPKLMAASVWMYRSSELSKSLRPMKLTTPTVTVCSYASGLPIAHTHSPTRSASELPRGAKASGVGDSTLMSATSVSGSEPIRAARRLLPSVRRRTMRSAASMT